MARSTSSWIDRAVKAALLAPFVVAMIIHGSTKPGPGQRPSRFIMDEYLADAGSYSTNSTVHIAATKLSAQIPDDTPLLAYAALMGTTNWLELLPRRTYADLPADWSLPDATNYDYIVGLDWAPPTPVVTNGILLVNALAAKDSVPPGPTLSAVLPAVALSHTLSASEYIQDGLIAMWDGIEHGDNPLVWRDTSGNGWDATQRVANAGWRWDADCYTGTAQNGHGFGTPLALASVLRDHINGHTIEIVFKPGNTSRQTIFGQYNSGSGSKGGINLEYSPHRQGYFRAYFDGSPDIDVPAWKNGLVRMTCSSVCNGTNLRIFENGEFSIQGAQPTSNRIGDYQFIIGGENGRANMSILGELCAVRLYSRALTDAEIGHNYNIDRNRFKLP